MKPATKSRERSRRPQPRRAGFQGALECAAAEDAIVHELCGPGMSVLPQQAAAAVALARKCVSDWVWLAYSSDRPIYQLGAEAYALVDAATEKHGDEPSRETMQRLEAITGSIPFDAAAVASLNAARWLVHRFEMDRTLH